jgi:hypothetical protein
VAGKVSGWQVPNIERALSLDNATRVTASAGCCMMQTGSIEGNEKQWAFRTKLTSVHCFQPGPIDLCTTAVFYIHSLFVRIHISTNALADCFQILALRAH